jgi:hypothetical protein
MIQHQLLTQKLLTKRSCLRSRQGAVSPTPISVLLLLLLLLLFLLPPPPSLLSLSLSLWPPTA